MKVKTLKDYRTRRHLRLRKTIKGTAECPRMSVFVSNKHMYVQFIDDSSSKTLASASTCGGELASAKLNAETAKQLGAIAAKAAQDKGISQVVFDRGGFAYHGRIAAMADAAREAGLKF